LCPQDLGPIGVAIIFGVDELMDMGRTCVNVIGNCLATVVVARWEGEFDDRRARVFGTTNGKGIRWGSRACSLLLARASRDLSARAVTY
jgi:hypothetical protein